MTDVKEKHELMGVCCMGEYIQLAWGNQGSLPGGSGICTGL